MSAPWPKTITLKFVAEETNEPLPSLVVFLSLLASRKNSFSLGPFWTDECGKVFVTKHDVETCLREAMAFAPADYASTIMALTGEIDVEVDSIEKLRSRLERIQDFYPEKARLLAEFVANCRNPTEGGFRERLSVSESVSTVRIRAKRSKDSN